MGGWGYLQRVGDNFEYAGHCRGVLAMELPGSRWSVGLPSRDIIRSIIRLRVVSRAIIGKRRADITEKRFLFGMPFSWSFMVM